MIARGPTRLEISYAIAGNQQKSAEINRNQFEIRNQKSRRAPHYTSVDARYLASPPASR